MEVLTYFYDISKVDFVKFESFESVFDLLFYCGSDLFFYEQVDTWPNLLYYLKQRAIFFYVYKVFFAYFIHPFCSMDVRKHYLKFPIFLTIFIYFWGNNWIFTHEGKFSTFWRRNCLSLTTFEELLLTFLLLTSSYIVIIIAKTTIHKTENPKYKVTYADNKNKTWIK